MLFEFIYFLLVCYIFFFLPGRLFFKLAKIDLIYPLNYFFPLVSGILMFTYSYYLFSYINSQFLVYPILILIFALCFKLKTLLLPKIPKNHRRLTIFALLAGLFFSLQMFLNGNFGNKIYFFGDDLAHLGYISELKNSFPPQHPGFAGIPLRGYHFFSDFLIASLSKTTLLSQFSLYFHFIPLLIAVGWSFGSYSVMYLWTKKGQAVFWGIFFVLFGSSFSFIMLLIKYPNSSIFNNFGINQPAGALYNEPYSLSVVFIFAFLSLVKVYLEKKNFYLLMLIGFIAGIVSIFKVYAGLILISGFFIFALSEIIHKNFKVIFSALIALLAFSSTFLVFAGKGAGLFYLPLWPIERTFDGIFPAFDYKEKIGTYTRLGVIKGIFITYTQGFSVFLIGNLGTRFIGIIFLIFEFKKRIPSLFSIILCTMIAESIILPLFFAQTINVFDMIQSAWYYPVLISLPAAMGMTAFWESRINFNIKKAASILVIVCTIPLFYYFFILKVLPLLSVERQSLQDSYFKSMDYLKTHGSYSDTVLEIPLYPTYTKIESLNNWFEHGSTVAITAFGNKRMFVGNQFIIFPNMPVYERLSFISEINKTEYAKTVQKDQVLDIVKNLKKNRIKYIYAQKELKIFKNSKTLVLVFKNPVSVIYKVNY